MLLKNNWKKENHIILCDFLSSLNNTTEKKVAVFDWDNTCIFNDFGDYFLFYLVKNNLLKISRNQFISTINTVTSASKLSTDFSRTFNYEIVQHLIKLFSFLKDSKNSHKSKNSLEKNNFFGLLLLFYNDILRYLGKKIAYTWIASLFAGYTPEKILETANNVFCESLKDNIEEVKVDVDITGLTIDKPIKYLSGIRIYDEIVDLIKNLQSSGTEVFIVSASYEHVVKGIASKPPFNIDKENIFGIKLKTKNGIITEQIEDESVYPVTYRSGKTKIIQKYICSKPIFVAGDSETDYEMLIYNDDTSIGLIINRNENSDIRKLHDKAVNLWDGKSKAFILQNIDSNNGKFFPK